MLYLTLKEEAPRGRKVKLKKNMIYYINQLNNKNGSNTYAIAYRYFLDDLLLL